jgi:hypothetical protein
MKIKFERKLSEMKEKRKNGGEEIEKLKLCGCGWKKKMIIKKGNKEGMKCEMFVMI